MGACSGNVQSLLLVGDTRKAAGAMVVDKEHCRDTALSQMSYAQKPTTVLQVVSGGWSSRLANSFSPSASQASDQRKHATASG